MQKSSSLKQTGLTDKKKREGKSGKILLHVAVRSRRRGKTGRGNRGWRQVLPKKAGDLVKACGPMGAERKGEGRLTSRILRRLLLHSRSGYSSGIRRGGNRELSEGARVESKKKK